MSKTIQIASDLHLEFLKNDVSFSTLIDPKADYLVLAGDIGYHDYNNYHNFLTECGEYFEKVFIITGNHEYYSKKAMKEIDQKIQDLCNTFDNVFFLNNKITTLLMIQILILCLLERLYGHIFRAMREHTLNIQLMIIIISIMVLIKQ
jgi:predicted phosphodiesterase